MYNRIDKGCVMACVIFGIRFESDVDELVNTFSTLVAEEHEKSVREDAQEFFNDLSVPVKLVAGYELWQPNNSVGSCVYLVMKKFVLIDDVEYQRIKPPSTEARDIFCDWCDLNGIEFYYR
jgi:hypothetical protein